MHFYLFLLFVMAGSTLATTIGMATKKTPTRSNYSTWTSTKTMLKSEIKRTSKTWEISTSVSESPLSSSNPGIDQSNNETTTHMVTEFQNQSNEQFYQTQLLTRLVEENGVLLRRLISMFSSFLENQIYRRDHQPKEVEQIHQNSSDETVTENDYMKKTEVHSHQANLHDNETLNVSFGTDADPDRYPWAVALSGNDRDRCGGTLVDDLHIVTAAHCIGTRVTRVSLGSHLYNSGEIVKTNFYCVHHAYSSLTSYRNDLAIIRLAKPVSVRYPKRVSSIEMCPPNHMLNNTLFTNQTDLWMIGWGLKNTEVEPNELQEARVMLAARSMCKGSSRYTDICVQSRSNKSPMGACTGDSGSGLFQHSLINNHWCLLAVASSSNTEICQLTQYSNYIQVSSTDYVDWFRAVLDRKNSLDDLQKLEKCKPPTVGQEFCRWYWC